LVGLVVAVVQEILQMLRGLLHLVEEVLMVEVAQSIQAVAEVEEQAVLLRLVLVVQEL
jgi:hypothetical protein